MIPGQAAIERWFAAALRAVEPAAAVGRVLGRSDRVLQIAGLDVDPRGRVWIAAVGKAAVPMARAAAAVCGDLLAGGVAITKAGQRAAPTIPRVKVCEAAHPIPDERGVAATRRLLSLLSGAGDGDLVLCLISGGGSALLEAPVAPVTLAEMARTTDLLLKAGAPIQDLNAVRTLLSLVKGGGLRRAAPLARFATLLLSDVIGNDPRVIASGPSIPQGADPGRAEEILRSYGVRDLVPASVAIALRSRSLSGEATVEGFADDLVAVIGDNRTALAGMRRAIEDDGLAAAVVWEGRDGEARLLGRDWVAACRSAPRAIDVVLGGGEATVTVAGPGIGGRNTEFALAAGLELERLGENGWMVASLATDGDDGPTDAAGAVADGETGGRARAAGVDPEAALGRNDSLAVFRAAGGVVTTGPTGTNVNDVYVGVRLAALRVDGGGR